MDARRNFIGKVATNENKTGRRKRRRWGVE
jgi:hypothetical protein